MEYSIARSPNLSSDISIWILIFGAGLQRRQWHPTPVLLPGKSHGRRSLVGCSPWGRWGSDTTEWLPFHFSFSCIGEGNGNPLQCSCLENPRDGEPGGLPSLGSHRVGHDCSDLAAAVFFVRWGCPVHFRMFSCISGLYLSWHPSPNSCDNQTCFKTLPYDKMFLDIAERHSVGLEQNYLHLKTMA